MPNSYYSEYGETKYIGTDTRDTYQIELKGLDFGTFTLDIKETLGDAVMDSIAYTNIPTSPSMSAQLTIQNITTASELSLDIDGDGTVDAVFTGDPDIDISASLDILTGIIETLDIQKGFKKDLLEKIKQAKKEFGKGKAEKAIKKLNEVIKKLEKEIRENPGNEGGGDKDEKNEHDDGEKEHNKKNHDDDEDENGDEYKKDNKAKISTMNAEMLIGIVGKIKEGMLE